MFTYHVLKFADFFSEGVETKFLLSDFAQQLSLINADVPYIYFTLLDTGGFISDSDFESECQR